MISRTLSCTKDVQLVQSSDGTNGGVGRGNVISVGMTPGGAKTRSELLLGASDLAALVEVTRARLRLRVSNSCASPGSAVKFYVESVTSDFEEGKYANTCGVGADNAEKWPGQSSSPTDRGEYSGSPSNGDVLSIDITDLVETARANGDATIALRLIASDGIGGYDESNANRYCGFWSREKGNDGGGYKPRIEVEGNDSHSPNAPLDVDPATGESATRVNTTFTVTGRFSDDDIPSSDNPAGRGDYMTASELEFYPATASDDGDGNVTGGSQITTIVGSGVRSDYQTGALDISQTVTVPQALVGREIRGRLRTKDSRGLWGSWTLLAAMRLIPNNRPTAPTHLSLNTALTQPIYHGHHNDPDVGSSCRGVETQVVKQTASGIEVIQNTTSFQPGDPTTGFYTTLNGTGAQTVSGGTSWAVSHDGRALRLGERIRRRHRTVDQYGAVGDWSPWVIWTVGQASAPTVTPDSDTKQDDLTPTLGAAFTEDADRLYLEAYSAKDLASTLLWASGAVTVSGTSPSIEYGSVGDAADLVWGQPIWVRTRVRITATGNLSEWSDLSFVWINALPDAPVLSVVDAVLGDDGIWRVPSVTPRIVLPFSDPDLPGDAPARQIAKAFQYPPGDTPAFSSDLSSGIEDFVDVPSATALLWETRYQLQGRYADSSHELGPITYLQVKTHRPPSLAVGTAPDVHDPRPAINWTATFYGTAGQKGYRVVVFDVTDAADPEQVLDTGFIEDDAADSYQVDPYVLETASDYQATVYVTDSEGLTSSLDGNAIIRGSATAAFDLTATAASSVETAAAALPADAFGRTTADSWGAADSGQTWSLSGTAADYDVGSGVGTIALTAANSSRKAYLLDAAVRDVTAVANIQTDKLAVGGKLYAGVAVRVLDQSNYYRAELQYNTDATVDLVVTKTVSGVRTVLGTFRTALTHVAGTAVWVKVSVDGSAFGYLDASIAAKAWQVGDPEPGWQVGVIDPESVLMGSGSVGLGCRSGSITNATVVVSFDDLSST